MVYVMSSYFSKRVIALAVMATALFAHTHTNAQIREDPREWAMLPKYCLYSPGYYQRAPAGTVNPAELARWKTMLGPTYEHIHHYCMALQEIVYADFFARTPQSRLRSLENSIGAGYIEYVIERATPGFALLPELHTKKGEVLVRLGKSLLAIAEFQRAIELKADYWPPYAAMSGIYKDTGDIAKAREWLEKGLAAAPDAKALARRLDELPPSKTSTRRVSKPAISSPAQDSSPPSTTAPKQEQSREDPPPAVENKLGAESSP